MTYIKNIWVDQEVERPKTYEMTNNSDGSVTLIDSFGLVSELGTPVNADNMNHIEEGIENNDLRITALENYTGTAIGDPVITLSNSLNENEIWLEGAEVSKTTYAKLFEIYGDTYGTAEDENNFILPDFRDKAIWGASDFGYLEAGLPNITGRFGYVSGSPDAYDNKLFSLTSEVTVNHITATIKGTDSAYFFNASKSNPIYGASTTVQPPSIKVRVKTRYA